MYLHSAFLFIFNQNMLKSYFKICISHFSMAKPQLAVYYVTASSQEEANKIGTALV